MPTAPARQCDRCRARVPSGQRCPTCSPAWATRSAASTKRTDTRRQRKARAARLRVSPLCAADCGRLAEIDDHVIPLAEGGDLDDEANHQTLCRPCHDEKSRAEALRGRTRAR